MTTLACLIENHGKENEANRSDSSSGSIHRDGERGKKNHSDCLLEEMLFNSYDFLSSRRLSPTPKAMELTKHSSLLLFEEHLAT
jgi:hypothetical protein